MMEFKKTHIRIAFIRQGHATNEAMDDYVIISHKGEDIYHVYYHDAFKAPMNHQFTILNAEELDLYLDALFALISRDSVPFREIQIDIPCMPSVMYKPSQLRSRRILEALGHAMPMLPITTIVYANPKNI